MMLTRLRNWRRESQRRKLKAERRKLKGEAHLSKREQYEADRRREELSPFNDGGVWLPENDPNWITPGADPRSDRR